MALKEFMLDGLVALVTGAGRGIGRGIALTLAEAGADVACVARTKKEIEATAASVRDLGRRGIAIPADITKPKHVERAVHDTLATLGHVDILVNNAGVVVRKPVVPYPPEMAANHPNFFFNRKKCWMNIQKMIMNLKFFQMPYQIKHHAQYMKIFL